MGPIDVWSLLPVLGLVFIAALLVGGLAGKADPEEARALCDGGAWLVDVRTKDEFSSGHIERALNLPVQEIERRIVELGDDKTRPVVLYCSSGLRSARAKRILVRAGFKDVRDLGAMSRWPG